MYVPSKYFLEMQERGRRDIIPPTVPFTGRYILEATFYLERRSKCDLVNLLQALQDILVDRGVVLDDNHKIIVGVDGSRVLYDKENPRTEFKLIELEEE